MNGHRREDTTKVKGINSCPLNSSEGVTLRLQQNERLFNL